MITRWGIALAAVAGWLLNISQTDAEVVRFHYAPDAAGNTRLVPAPSGAPAERSAWIGGPREPYSRQVSPNSMVTFRHPYTGQNINVPFIFPMGTPRVEHRFDRILYVYSGYEIRTRFLPDGSVEVLYNSGALRPLAFQ